MADEMFVQTPGRRVGNRFVAVPPGDQLDPLSGRAQLRASLRNTVAELARYKAIAGALGYSEDEASRRAHAIADARSDLDNAEVFLMALEAMVENAPEDAPTLTEGEQFVLNRLCDGFKPDEISQQMVDAGLRLGRTQQLAGKNAARTAMIQLRHKLLAKTTEQMIHFAHKAGLVR
jgi:hypothetical protein